MVKIDVPLSKLSQNWNCITFWTTLYVAIEYIVANLLLIAYVKHGTSKANSLPNRPICPKQACHPWSNELKWLSKVTVGNSLSASVVDVRQLYMTQSATVCVHCAIYICSFCNSTMWQYFRTGRLPSHTVLCFFLVFLCSQSEGKQLQMFHSNWNQHQEHINHSVIY